MPEPNESQFIAAHDLAERLYTMQKEQADRMLDLLSEQGKTLSGLVTDVEVVKEQTKEVPTLKERVSRLEEFKWKIAGWTAGAFIAAWVIEHLTVLQGVFK